MSTDKADEQEAPGVRINETDEEDTSGHKYATGPPTPTSSPRFSLGRRLTRTTPKATSRTPVADRVPKGMGGPSGSHQRWCDPAAVV